MDGQVWNGPQGAKVSLLPLGLSRIARTAGDDSGEVAYPVYLVAGQQQVRQLANVQPSIGCTSQGAIVEIEAINVDVGTDEGRSFHKKLRLPFGSLAPCRRSIQGVYAFKVAKSIQAVNSPKLFGSCNSPLTSGLGRKFLCVCHTRRRFLVAQIEQATKLDFASDPSSDCNAHQESDRIPSRARQNRRPDVLIGYRTYIVSV